MAVELSRDDVDPRLLVVAASLFGIGGVLSSSLLISAPLLAVSGVASGFALAYAADSE